VVQTWGRFFQTVLRHAAKSGSGSVSHLSQRFHGSYLIPIQHGETINGAGYAGATGRNEAHELTMECC
jgi:hypothetical protein